MFAPGPRLRRGRDPGFLDLVTLLPEFISMLPFYFDLSLGALLALLVLSPLHL